MEHARAGDETLRDSGQLQWELLLSGECQEKSPGHPAWALPAGSRRWQLAWKACVAQREEPGVATMTMTPVADARGSRQGSIRHGPGHQKAQGVVVGGWGFSVFVGRLRGRPWEEGSVQGFLKDALSNIAEWGWLLRALGGAESQDGAGLSLSQDRGSWSRHCLVCACTQSLGWWQTGP